MNHKYIWVSFIMVVLVTACSSQRIEDSFMDFSYSDARPTLVDEIPEGFVVVDYILELYQDILDMNFSGARVSLSDIDNRHLIGWFIDDCTVWVQHGSSLYIDESFIKKVLPAAIEAAELRNIIHYVGEPIETFNRRGNPAIVTIDKVSYASSFEGLVLEIDEWLCIVEFSLDYYNAEQIKQIFDDERLSEQFLSLYAGWRFFHHAETTGGQDIFDVLELNKPFMIAFRLPRGTYAEILYIQSHDATSTNLRRIDIR